MSNHNQIFFVDGFTNLSYSAGAFRFDLGAILPNAQQNHDSTKVNAQTQAHIVMTPQGFVQTIKALQEFLKQVEEKGIIKFGEQSTSASKTGKPK